MSDKNIENVKIYCLKCRAFTDSIKMRLIQTKNKRFILVAKCSQCQNKKYKFVSKSKHGKGFINSIINKLPIELHVPGYQYCGPGTKLEQRLNRGDSGINRLDKSCKQHDIHYEKFKTASERHPADRELANIANQVIQDSNSKLKEKLVARLVKATMNTKVKLGLGL